jgi:hypothetical protein
MQEKEGEFSLLRLGDGKVRSRQGLSWQLILVAVRN